MKGSGKNTIHFKNQFSYFTGTCEAHVKDHSFHHSFQKTSFFILPIWLYYNISNIYHIASTKWRDLQTVMRPTDSETESLQSSCSFLSHEPMVSAGQLLSRANYWAVKFKLQYYIYPKISRHHIFFSVRKMSWIVLINAEIFTLKLC